MQIKMMMRLVKIMKNKENSSLKLLILVEATKGKQRNREGILSTGPNYSKRRFWRKELNTLLIRNRAIQNIPLSFRTKIKVKKISMRNKMTMTVTSLRSSWESSKKIYVKV